MTPKPCPFCGSTNIEPSGCITEYKGADGYQDVCLTCDATGPARRTSAAATRAWNTRKSRNTRNGKGRV